MSKLIYVSYASYNYKENIFWNSFLTKHFIRPDKQFFLTDKDLKKSSIYVAAKEIFNNEKGGYYAWKPWAILEAAKHSRDGDIILYHDCGKGLKYKNFFRPNNIIKYARVNGAMPGVLVPHHGRNKKWTHLECFKIMGCDSEEYFDSSQVQASISAWRVDKNSRQFLEEWLEYCTNLDVIQSVPENLKKSQMPDFVAHRYDQSVLTNLVIKNKLKPVLPSFELGYLSKSMLLVDLDLNKKSLVSRTLLSLIINFYRVYIRCKKKLIR